MAFVIFHDRKPATLTHHQAVELDKVVRGLVVGSPRQKQFAKRVRKIYFSKQHEQPVVLQVVPDVPLPEYHDN